jgi:polyisoprenoid-binding protein YceI
MGSWFIRGIAATVIIVVAAIAAWWFFVREDAELATSPLDFRETPADTGTPTAVDAANAAATMVTSPTSEPSDPVNLTPSEGYTLYLVVTEDPGVEGQTEAAYFAGETLASVGVPSTAKGSTAEVSGHFSLGAGGLDPAVGVQISVGLANIRSDESRRDNRMREALEVTKYPLATFTAASIGGWTGEIPEGQEVNLTITGTMDLHGVQKELTWDVIARRQGDVVTALATVTFLYADFEIPVLNFGGFVSVEEDVTLQVQLIAKAQ